MRHQNTKLASSLVQRPDPDASRSGRASVSIDLDNEWAYLRTQGVEQWRTLPSYLDKVVPRILSELQAAGLSATFFVVGKDASLQENANALRQIADEGHEIANHSFMHEPWLHLYSHAELRDDFEKSERAIFNATGTRPAGFRGPGFSTSRVVRQVLVERGYHYDASVFPTTLGPLAKAYFLFNSNLSPAEREKRAGLYGSFADAFRPLRPFEIEPGLTEVPVTTMPLFRFPVHLSYLLFLAQHSEALARIYWRVAVTLCRMHSVGPSLLLHPTDFLDATDAPRMSFFPAMKIGAKKKVALLRFAIGTLTRHWLTGTVAAHARETVPRAGLSPIFKTSPQTTA